MKKYISDKQIMDSFTDDKDKNNYSYLHHNSKRYEFLIKIVNEYAKKLPKRKKLDITLLDIGPAYQTVLFSRLFDNLDINTLGFSSFGLQTECKHIEFDLNECKHKGLPVVKKYDIVVMAEVIEHLHISPEIIFDCIKKIMAPGGYLIIQTPNAVVLGKRIKMLWGYNPQQMISRQEYSAHIREYTLKELIYLGNKARLRIVKYYLKDYFKSNSSLFNLIRKIFKISRNFREGITIIYKKDENSNIP